MHNIKRLQGRDRGDEQRRHDRKIFRDVIGNRKGGQGTPGHQQLFADLNDLDQLRRVVIEIHHVTGFFGRLRSAVHGYTYVCLCERGGVIRSISHHRHQFAALLFFLDIVHFIFGLGLGDKIIHPGLFSNIFRRQRVVTGDHHGLYPHLPETFEPLLDTRLDDVLQFDHAQRYAVLADSQRSSTIGSNLFYL